MNSINNRGPHFKSAFMGYNKTEVDDYVARAESELGLQESRKEKWEQQTAELNAEISRLRNLIESERLEKQQILEKLDESGANPKTIQDAILNAQRMSEIVIREAHEKAEEVRIQAEANRHVQEEEGKRAVENAQKESDRMIAEAKERCNRLQQDYDRILMDVTDFKAEMLKMYRRHMELLASLPEKEIPELEGEYREADTMQEEIIETET